jgi:hypothetical protein
MRAWTASDNIITEFIIVFISNLDFNCIISELLYTVFSFSIKTALTDSLSLIGHAQFYISQRRRYNIRPYINDKYKPICNSDVPISNKLLGNNCHKRIKELGDPTKIPFS